MFDMSPGARERRAGEAELAAYHMAKDSAMTHTLNKLEKAILLKNRLADIYHLDFSAYLNTTGLCPNCDKPMVLPACSCGCEFPPTLGRWVMRHYVVQGGQRICDYQEPLWEWKEGKTIA